MAVRLAATAAAATGCPPQVAPWTKAPAGESSTRSTRGRRTIIPPMGAYPEVAPLAKVIRSGDASTASDPNQLPIRPKAVITSSAARSNPYSSQMRRSSGQ